MGAVDSKQSSQMTIEAIRQRFMAGELAEAIAMTTAVINKAKAEQDAFTLASVLDLRGDIAMRGGALEEARLAYLAAHETYSMLGSEVGIANVELSLGRLFHRQGDPTTARTHLENARGRYERAGRKIGHGQVELCLGMLDRADNRPADAGRHWRTAHELFLETDSKRDLAEVRFQIAEMAAACGLPGAVAHLHEALAAYTVLEDAVGVANVNLVLGRTAIDLGDFEAALRYLDEACRLYEQVGSGKGLADAHELRGKLGVRRREAQAAPGAVPSASATPQIEARWRLLDASFSAIMQAYAQVGPRARDSILFVCVADTSSDRRARAAAGAAYGVTTGLHAFVANAQKLVELCGGLPADTLDEIGRARPGVLNMVILAHDGILCASSFWNPLTDKAIIVPMGAHPPARPQA